MEAVIQTCRVGITGGTSFSGDQYRSSSLRFLEEIEDEFLEFERQGIVDEELLQNLEVWALELHFIREGENVPLSDSGVDGLIMALADSMAAFRVYLAHDGSWKAGPEGLESVLDILAVEATRIARAHAREEAAAA